jgi:hypothetical protein
MSRLSCRRGEYGARQPTQRADLPRREQFRNSSGAHRGTIGGPTKKLEVDSSFEITPSVLWDGVVVLDSEEPSLGENGQAIEFLKDQYRHSKTILLFGRARALLGKLGRKATDRNGPVDGDAGLLGFDEDSARPALAVTSPPRWYSIATLTAKPIHRVFRPLSFCSPGRRYESDASYACAVPLVTDEERNRRAIPMPGGGTLSFWQFCPRSAR